MNIGSLSSIVVPVLQMPLAASPDKMPSFEQLMPRAELMNGVVAALAEGPQTTADFPETAATGPGSGQTMQPAPEAKRVRNAPQPRPTMTQLPIRAVATAEALPSQIDDEVETLDDEPHEPALGPEVPFLTLPKPEAPASHLSSPFSQFAELKPTQTIIKREPDIASIVELPEKRISPEKSVSMIALLPPASEVSQPAAITPPVAPSEPATTGHLDLAHDTLWLDQLAREIVAVASTDGRLKFRLSPATLGSLDVAISTQADGVNIQLQPSTETAARIFAAEQSKLTEELRQSGIKLVNSDLLGGQHMGPARDQSQAQHSDRGLPFRQSAEPTSPTALNPTPTQPQRGRFA
jgi:flagellar hook-length control protein FliK